MIFQHFQRCLGSWNQPQNPRGPQTPNRRMRICWTPSRRLQGRPCRLTMRIFSAFLGARVIESQGSRGFESSNKYGKMCWFAGWWFQSLFIFHNIYIWDNPSHWLSYFSRWLLHHQPGVDLVFQGQLPLSWCTSWDYFTLKRSVSLMTGRTSCWFGEPWRH